jgi:hypothetical protein
VGYRTSPGGTYVMSAGCYGVQVDGPGLGLGLGLGFSRARESKPPHGGNEFKPASQATRWMPPGRWPSVLVMVTVTKGVVPRSVCRSPLSSGIRARPLAPPVTRRWDRATLRKDEYTLPRCCALTNASRILSQNTGAP